jgi:hypothetical protein
MPRSDWGIVAALIGCLALAWLALGDAHYRENKATAAYDHSERTEQIETERAGIPFEAERFASNPEPKNAAEREKRDLAAQEASAAWGFWVALFAGVQLIATIVGLYFIKRTLDATLDAVEDTGLATQAMLKQNEIAETNAHLQLRAYLSVDTRQSGWTDPTSSKIEGQVVVKNTGQTPAFNVQTAIGFVVGKNKPVAIPIGTKKSSIVTIGSGQESRSVDGLGRNLAVAERLALSGGSRIWFMAKITYTDIFGEKWETNMCQIGQMEANGIGLDYYEDGNYAT